MNLKTSRNGFSALCLTLLLCVCLVKSAHAITRYHAIDLGVGGGTSSWPTGISTNNLVCGWASVGSLYEGVGSTGWSLTEIPTLNPSGSWFAEGVNSSNTVVGYSQSISGSVTTDTACYEQNGGAAKPILDPSGQITPTQAYGINSSGTIVGAALQYGYFPQAFLYSNGKLTNLGSLNNSDFATATAISDTGYVAGWSFVNSSQVDAFLRLPSGALTDAGTLGTGAYALAVDNNGDLVGHALINGYNFHAFYVPRGGSVVDLGLMGPSPSTVSSDAYGVNDKGQIVGDCNGFGAIWEAAQLINLNTLSDYIGSIVSASAINDNGYIAATGKINGAYHALLLVPQTQLFL